MKILIIEDDASVGKAVKEGLEAAMHTVEISPDGQDGSFLARNFEYDVIVLDYSLPKKDGISVCREIRASGKTTPILFLSVNGDVELKVTALENGADDYMTKPYSFSELQSRIRALARRPSAIRSSIRNIGDLVLDENTKKVTRGDREISLTRKEYLLLEYFMRHPGMVLSRAILMEHVWSADSDILSNTIESHIRNLRRKINAGNKPDLIRNLIGLGYCLEKP